MTTKQNLQILVSLDSIKADVAIIDQKVNNQHLKLNELKMDVLKQFANHLSIHDQLEKKIKKYVVILAGSIIVAVLFNRPEYVAQVVTFFLKVF